MDNNGQFPLPSSPGDFAWNKKRNVVYSILERIVGPVRLLDIGCNNGTELQQYSKIVQGELFGIDYNNSFIKDGTLSFIRGDARHLPIRSDSLDVITTTEVIEHFIEGEQFIQEVHRILKDNGLLVVTTPNRDRITAFPKNILAKIKKDTIVKGPIDEHVREYTYRELEEILEVNGFQISYVQYIGLNPYIRIPVRFYYFLDKITDKYLARFAKWDMLIVANKTPLEKI